MLKTKTRVKKYFGRFREPLAEIPNLVVSQVESFQRLIDQGLKEVFAEFSSIKDFSERKFELDFVSFELAEPKIDEYTAKDKKLSYEAPLKVRVRLKNLIQKTDKEQEIFMAVFPLMTSHGTFIISGIERVVVPQLARSTGVSFTEQELKGKKTFGAKIIPARGAWIELETDLDGAIYIRVDRKRKFPVTTLLRAFGAETNDKILGLFTSVPEAKHFIEKTLAKDHTTNIDEASIEIHKRLRDGDLASSENARDFVKSIFDKERYDLSRVGRFRFNNHFPYRSPQHNSWFSARRYRSLGFTPRATCRRTFPTEDTRWHGQDQAKHPEPHVDYRYRCNSAGAIYFSQAFAGQDERIFHHKPTFAIHAADQCLGRA